jgi:two-component system sensor histidine kinase PilS (NtrC family)
MKDRMAALGEMAAGLAHEIRNPLASIRGSAQMLQRDLNLREEEGRLFDVLVRETERLNRTIETFLHYARGGRPTRFERVDVMALLEDATSLLRHSGECRPEHAITVSGERGGPLWCRGDSDRLKQVFWNLALNALQAMPQGGPLSISASEKGSEIEILFRDAGRGIPPDEISNIFLPFRSSSTRGLGLGLPIAYRVVESHGGSIHVEGAEGEGTVVRVRLPRAEAEKTPVKLAGGQR